jgi:hypothetical protein
MILAVTTATFLNEIKHGFGSYKKARVSCYADLLRLLLDGNIRRRLQILPKDVVKHTVCSHAQTYAGTAAVLPAICRARPCCVVRFRMLHCL